MASYAAAGGGTSCGCSSSDESDYGSDDDLDGVFGVEFALGTEVGGIISDTSSESESESISSDSDSDSEYSSSDSDATALGAGLDEGAGADALVIEGPCPRPGCGMTARRACRGCLGCFYCSDECATEDWARHMPECDAAASAGIGAAYDVGADAARFAIGGGRAMVRPASALPRPPRALPRPPGPGPVPLPGARPLMPGARPPGPGSGSGFGSGPMPGARPLIPGVRPPVPGGPPRLPSVRRPWAGPVVGAWGAWRPRRYSSGSRYYGRFDRGWGLFGRDPRRWFAPWLNINSGFGVYGNPFGFYLANGFYYSPYFPEFAISPWRLRYALAMLSAYGGNAYNDYEAVEAALIAASQADKAMYRRWYPTLGLGGGVGGGGVGFNIGFGGGGGVGFNVGVGGGGVGY
jgi:hypothetical protein